MPKTLSPKDELEIDLCIAEAVLDVSNLKEKPSKVVQSWGPLQQGKHAAKPASNKSLGLRGLPMAAKKSPEQPAAANKPPGHTSDSSSAVSTAADSDTATSQKQKPKAAPKVGAAIAQNRSKSISFPQWRSGSARLPPQARPPDAPRRASAEQLPTPGSIAAAKRLKEAKEKPAAAAPRAPAAAAKPPAATGPKPARAASSKRSDKPSKTHTNKPEPPARAERPSNGRSKDHGYAQPLPGGSGPNKKPPKLQANPGGAKSQLAPAISIRERSSSYASLYQQGTAGTVPAHSGGETRSRGSQEGSPGQSRGDREQHGEEQQQHRQQHGQEEPQQPQEYGGWDDEPPLQQPDYSARPVYEEDSAASAGSLVNGFRDAAEEELATRPYAASPKAGMHSYAGDLFREADGGYSSEILGSLIHDHVSALAAAEQEYEEETSQLTPEEKSRRLREELQKLQEASFRVQKRRTTGASLASSEVQRALPVMQQQMGRTLNSSQTDSAASISGANSEWSYASQHRQAGGAYGSSSQQQQGGQAGSGPPALGPPGGPASQGPHSSQDRGASPSSEVPRLSSLVAAKPLNWSLPGTAGTGTTASPVRQRPAASSAGYGADIPPGWGSDLGLHRNALSDTPASEQYRWAGAGISNPTGSPVQSKPPRQRPPPSGHQEQSRSSSGEASSSAATKHKAGDGSSRSRHLHRIPSSSSAEREPAGKPSKPSGGTKKPLKKLTPSSSSGSSSAEPAPPLLPSVPPLPTLSPDMLAMMGPMLAGQAGGPMFPGQLAPMAMYNMMAMMQGAAAQQMQMQEMQRTAVAAAAQQQQSGGRKAMMPGVQAGAATLPTMPYMMQPYMWPPPGAVMPAEEAATPAQAPGGRQTGAAKKPSARSKSGAAAAPAASGAGAPAATIAYHPMVTPELAPSMMYPFNPMMAAALANTLSTQQPPPSSDTNRSSNAHTKSTSSRTGAAKGTQRRKQEEEAAPTMVPTMAAPPMYPYNPMMVPMMMGTMGSGPQGMMQRASAIEAAQLSHLRALEGSIASKIDRQAGKYRTEPIGGPQYQVY